MSDEYSSLYPKIKKKPVVDAKSISNYINGKIISDEMKKKNAKKNYLRYGKSKEYIEIGKKERLSVVSDFSIKDRIITDVEFLKLEEILAYAYGYTEAASRMLVIGITGNTLTKEQLLYMGYIDALDQNIEFEQLPATVKENKFYLAGYKQGLEELNSHNKHK